MDRVCKNITSAKTTLTTMAACMLATMVACILVLAQLPLMPAIAFAEDGDPSSPPAVYIKELYIKIAGDTNYVGDNAAKKYREIAVETKGKTIDLNAYYTNTADKDSGVELNTENPGTILGEIPIIWTSSNNAIATVSPSGIVTPLKNGSVIISVKVADAKYYDGAVPTRTVIINFDGQEGEYVSKVVIIDKSGTVLSKKGSTKVFYKENEFFDFYAKVTWVDSAGKLKRTEDTRTDGVSSTLTWSMGGSTKQVPATINKTTGKLKTGVDSGNAIVICSVTGGVGGKTIKSNAKIQLNTGKYAYNPSDSLTIKVIYQNYPKTIVQAHTYSYKSLLKKLKSYTNNYTIVRSKTGYGVLRAKGFLYKDVVALEGVELDDVYQFRFGTSDDYDNPITYKQLYGSGKRYYFPNWDIGSKAQGKVVAPILAYQSNLVWDQSEADPTQPLDDGTRFRLAFGPLWNMSTNSSFQIYYINSITIVLTGSPKAKIGDGEDKTNGGATSNGKKSGGSGSGDYGENGKTVGASKNAPTAKVGEGAVGVSSVPSSASRDWHVYEMMSRAASEVKALELAMPFLPIAIPLAAAGASTGFVVTFISYRRRLT